MSAKKLPAGTVQKFAHILQRGKRILFWESGPYADYTKLNAVDISYWAGNGGADVSRTGRGGEPT